MTELKNPSGSTTPNLDPPIADASEIRLSWIYKLRKSEIDAELEKFRLDLTGTVDEKRKRLVRFIKEGCTSPQPDRLLNPPTFPAPPPLPPAGAVSPPVNQSTAAGPAPPYLTMPPQLNVPIPAGAVSTVTVSTVCERVRKWNLHFNGRTDAVEFLEKLCEFQEHSGIPTADLLPSLYEIFQGNALAWYRNNRGLWNGWEDFITDFRQFYLPANYESFLEEEIYHRRQQPGEGGRDYVVALQTLLRRHGGFSPEKALYRLHGNLLPDYKEYIRLSDLQGIRDLVRRIEEYEAIQKERSVPKPRQATTVPDNRQRAAAPPQPERPSPGRNQGPTAPAPRAPGMTGNSGNPNRTGTAPTAPRPTTRAADGGTASTSSSYDRTAICWRCGNTGHFRSQCKAPPRLFCSRCGKSGIMTRDCQCPRPEN